MVQAPRRWIAAVTTHQELVAGFLGNSGSRRVRADETPASLRIAAAVVGWPPEGANKRRDQSGSGGQPRGHSVLERTRKPRLRAQLIPDPCQSFVHSLTPHPFPVSALEDLIWFFVANCSGRPAGGAGEGRLGSHSQIKYFIKFCKCFY